MYDEMEVRRGSPCAFCGFTVETEPGGMKNRRRGAEFYEQLLNLVDNFQIARCTVRSRCVVL